MQTTFTAIRTSYDQFAVSHAGRTRWRQWQASSPELAGFPSLGHATAAARQGDTGAPVLKALVRLHRAGDSGATAVLLEALRPMLQRVSTYARTERYTLSDRREEQAAATVAAALVALQDATAAAHVGVYVYYKTLQAVCRAKKVSIADAVCEELPEPSYVPEFLGDETDVAAEALINWVHEAGVIGIEDVQALRHVFLRNDNTSIRAAAEELGIPARRLESRVRRAIEKISRHVPNDAGELFSIIASTNRHQRPVTQSGRIAA